jgi:hypothetical protein
VNLASNCGKSGKKPEMRRDKGHFGRKSRFHFSYHNGLIPRILPAASLPVRAGTGGSFCFFDSAETT